MFPGSSTIIFTYVCLINVLLEYANDWELIQYLELFFIILVGFFQISFIKMIRNIIREIQRRYLHIKNAPLMLYFCLISVS